MFQHTAVFVFHLTLVEIQVANTPPAEPQSYNIPPNTSQSRVEPRSNHKTIHHTPPAWLFYLLMMTAPLYMTEKVGMLTLRRFSA